MGATYVGVRRAHPYSWLLSSPQQPLETEDSPTVSLAPQYTSQRLCRAREFLVETLRANVLIYESCKHRILHSRASKIECRFFPGGRVETAQGRPNYRVPA